MFLPPVFPMLSHTSQALPIQLYLYTLSAFFAAVQQSHQISTRDFDLASEPNRKYSLQINTGPKRPAETTTLMTLCGQIAPPTVPGNQATKLASQI